MFIRTWALLLVCSLCENIPKNMRAWVIKKIPSTISHLVIKLTHTFATFFGDFCHFVGSPVLFSFPIIALVFLFLLAFKSFFILLLSSTSLSSLVQTDSKYYIPIMKWYKQSLVLGEDKRARARNGEALFWTSFLKCANECSSARRPTKYEYAMNWYGCILKNSTMLKTIRPQSYHSHTHNNT